MEFVLMGLTLAGVAGSVFLAHLMYIQKPELPAQIAAKMKGLYEGSLNKWYVDELYDMVLITPIVTGSRQVLWAIVDSVIIDGVVNGVAKTATTLGTLHGRIGNGKVQAYAISIAAGTALLVTAYALG
jgi:NADH-quinone oxidoreductase subunit L